MSNRINSCATRDGTCVRINGRAICMSRISENAADLLAKFAELYADEIFDAYLLSGNQHEIGKKLKEMGYVSKSTIHSA